MQAMASSCLKFLDHTWHVTVSGTPLDKWSARCRDLYLTTHNAHNRETAMSPAGFEPTILTGEQLQTYALEGMATVTAPIMIHTYCYLWLQQCIYNCNIIQRPRRYGSRINVDRRYASLFCCKSSQLVVKHLHLTEDTTDGLES